MTLPVAAPIVSPTRRTAAMKSTSLAAQPDAEQRVGTERRSAASVIERETEARLQREGARMPLLPLLGAAVTAVIALAAAGALLA